MLGSDISALDVSARLVPAHMDGLQEYATFSDLQIYNKSVCQWPTYQIFTSYIQGTYSSAYL
jgi:hypothetical protein